MARIEFDRTLRGKSIYRVEGGTWRHVPDEILDLLQRLAVSPGQEFWTQLRVAEGNSVDA